jgi:hypothetical protein
MVLVDAGRPLSILAAQLSYMIEPLLGRSGSDWVDFMSSLADEKGAEEFLDQLDRDRGDS